MKKIILLLFLSLFFCKYIYSQSKRDELRLQKMIPLKVFYDSIVKKTHVQYAITIFDGKINRYYVGNRSYNSIDYNNQEFIDYCDFVGLGYSNFLKTIELMNQVKCISIASSGTYETNDFVIFLCYKFGNWSGHWYYYVFPIGEKAIEDAKTNYYSYKLIAENIYRFIVHER